MEGEQTQELPEAKAEDSGGVAKEFQTHEFQRTNQEKESIEKLAEAMEAQPELSETKSQEELSNTDSSQTKEELPPKKEAFNHEKWDGKVEKLPDNIRKIISDNQAAYTAKAQEASQLRKELEQRTVKVEQTKDQPLMSPEEFEEAQLSSAKFLEVSERIANRAIEKRVAELMPILSKVQHTQTVVENEKAINDFAAKNPDFWDLYEASPLMQSLIDRHKNLEEPYKMVKAFEASIAEKTKNDNQARVKEKKAASTFGRTAKHTENVMYVDGNADEVLAKQVEMTMSGKNIQVRKKK